MSKGLILKSGQVYETTAADTFEIPGPSTIGGMVTAAATTALTIKGSIADGASAVGIILDNVNALSTAGSKIASFRNATTERAYLTYDGTFGVVNTYTAALSSAVKSGGAGLWLGLAAPSTTNYALWSNGGVLNLNSVSGNTIDFNVAGSLVARMGTGGALTLGGASSTAGIFATVLDNNSSVGSTLYVGNGYAGIIQIGRSTAEVRIYDRLTIGGVSGSPTLASSSTTLPFWIKGAQSDGASAVSVAIDSPSYANTGAKLLSIRNNAVEKAYFDKDGKLSTAVVRVYETRTLPTTAGQYVELGSYSITNGAHSFQLHMVVPSSGFSVAKSYEISVLYGQTTTNWLTVPPSSSSGSYAGNDYELEINVNAGVVALRIRRSLGTTAGTVYTTIVSGNADTDVWTAASGTGTSVAAGYFDPANLFSTLKGVVADSGSAVGNIIDTYATYATTGAKLLSIRNAGSEKVYVNKDGELYVAGSTYLTQYGLRVGNAGYVGMADASTLGVYGNMPNSGTAIGVKIGTNSASYSTDGAKLVSFQNALAERSYVTHEGSYVATRTGSYIQAGGGLTAGFTAVVGGTNHTDATALSYRGYFAYDCRWDDANDKWVANRTTIGGKLVMTAGYHDGGFRWKSYTSGGTGDLVNGWADADMTTMMTLSTVGSLTVESAAIGSISVLAGFADRTSTLSFNNGSRQFTITPSGSFVVWANNIKYTKSGAESVTIPNTVGLHFIYYNASGVLTTDTASWDLTSDQLASVATIYWDGAVGVLGDERHGAWRNRNNHIYLHNTRGTAYDSGLGGTFTNTTLSIATGIIWDEDIKFSLTGPYTTCRLWYRASGGTVMASTGGSATPYAVNVGTLQYDNAGTLTNASNNNYVMNWVYATNDVEYPIAVVVGQAAYATLIGARNAPQPTFPNLSTREWKLLYSVLYRNAAGTATFIESTDYRTSSSIPASGITSLPAISVTVTPAGNIASANVQGALEELDTEKLKNTTDTLTGDLTVTNSVLTPTVDTASAITLNLGTVTASAVSIGKSGATATVLGSLTVNENLIITGTETIVGGTTFSSQLGVAPSGVATDVTTTFDSVLLQFQYAYWDSAVSVTTNGYAVKTSPASAAAGTGALVFLDAGTTERLRIKSDGELVSSATTNALSMASGVRVKFSSNANEYIQGTGSGDLTTGANLNAGIIRASNNFMGPSTTSLILWSRVSDGGTAIAHKFYSNATLATNGAKIASFYNDQGSTEVAWITKDGGGYFNSHVSVGNTLYASSITRTTANPVTIKVAAANTGTGIGVILGTNTDDTTAGDKLVSIQNNAVEKAFIDKDGGFSSSGAIYSAAGSGLFYGRGIQYNAGLVGIYANDATKIASFFAFPGSVWTERAYIDNAGLGYFAGGIKIGPNTQSVYSDASYALRTTTGRFDTSVLATTVTANLYTNSNAGSTTGSSYTSTLQNGASSIGHYFNTNLLDVSGGKLISILNNSVEKAFFDKDGYLNVSSGAVHLGRDGLSGAGSIRIAAGNNGAHVPAFRLGLDSLAFDFMRYYYGTTLTNVLSGETVGQQHRYAVIGHPAGGNETLSASFTHVGIETASIIGRTATPATTLSAIQPSSVTIKGSLADGGTTVGVILDTEVAYSTSGAKILSLRNAGVEKASIAHDGGATFNHVYTSGPLIGSSTMGSGVHMNATNTSLALTGRITDGATAIAVKIGNLTALSTTGAKIVSFYSDAGSTEKVYIDKDGNVIAGTVGLWSQYNAVIAPIFTSGGNNVTVLRGDAANAVDAIGVNIRTNNVFNLAGAKIVQFSNGATEKAYIDKDGIVAAAGHYPAVSGAVTVSGTAADGGTAVGVVADNTVTLASAGAKLLSIRNAGTEKSYFALDGGLTISGVAASGTALSIPTNARVYMGSAPYLYSDNSWIYLQGSTGLAVNGRVGSGSLRAYGSNNPILMFGRVNDAASAIANRVGNEVAFTGTYTGQKIMAWYNDASLTVGQEQAYINKDGSFVVVGAASGSDAIAIPSGARLTFDGPGGTRYMTWNGSTIGMNAGFSAGNNTCYAGTMMPAAASRTFQLWGRVTDGGTAIAVQIGCVNPGVNTAGSKIVSFYSDQGSTERAYIDYLGGATFSSNVNITGALTATTKSFLINHPTKPGKKLRYGSLEGPENGVYVRGRLTGSAVIHLPDYWSALVDKDSITVTLTAIGSGQDLFVEHIEGTTIIVGRRCGFFHKEIDCFYMVFAERKDVAKLEVEF